MITNYKELRVWIAAEELFEFICEDIKKFPQNKIAWIIADQLIRSAGSIGANVAEGFARKTKNDILHFFTIAYGSAIESEVWINRAVKQKLISEEAGKDRIEKIESILKMINKFKSSLNKTENIRTRN